MHVTIADTTGLCQSALQLLNKQGFWALPHRSSQNEPLLSWHCDMGSLQPKAALTTRSSLTSSCCSKTFSHRRRLLTQAAALREQRFELLSTTTHSTVQLRCAAPRGLLECLLKELRLHLASIRRSWRCPRNCRTSSFRSSSGAGTKQIMLTGIVRSFGCQTNIFDHVQPAFGLLSAELEKNKNL